MGEKITMTASGLHVPDEPIIPYIEGDGTGPDIWAAAVRVLDGAVAAAYGGRRRIEWLEVLAGEKANERTGSWLPDDTEDAFREYLVGIKGPLTTPVGTGIRSLNVALRQKTRPVRLSASGQVLPWACRRRCARPRTSTWSSSGRTPKTSTPASR